MIYPTCLKEGDCLGITAPSAGAGHKLAEYEICLSHLREQGFRIRETADVRIDGLISASAVQRARQLESLAADDRVAGIICAAGGDFLLEMIPRLNFKILAANPKWLLGMSDPSSLLYILTTKYDIATLYGYNAGGFLSEREPKPWKDCIRILKGRSVSQSAYRNWYADDREAGYPDKAQPAGWQTPNGGFRKQGRMIGGCLDVIRELIGTPYDATAAFIDKYREDGFIWFLDIYSLSAEEVYRTLIQMRECGYFRYCRAVLAGRVAFPSSDTGMSYQQALRRIFGRKIPLALEADIGHTYPAMAIINGALAELEAGQGGGRIRFIKK